MSETETRDAGLTATERETLYAPDRRMDAYYYSFEPTGVPAIDAILSAVAHAGKGYHNTSDWSDAGDEDFPGRWGAGRSCIDVIQAAANEAAESAAELSRLRGVVEAVQALADDLEWKRPEKCPCDDPESCCGSEASCDAMQPSVRVIGASDLRAALAPVSSSGEAESGSSWLDEAKWEPASWCRHPACRATNWCGTGRVHMRGPECPPDPDGQHLGWRPEDGPLLNVPAPSGEAESGDDRDPKPCPKCGQVCTYDGWDHVHSSGIGIGSCDGSGSIPVPSGEAESGEWRATCERCGAHPGHVHAGPTSGAYLCPSCYAREAGEAESGEGGCPSDPSQPCTPDRMCRRCAGPGRTPAPVPSGGQADGDDEAPWSDGLGSVLLFRGPLSGRVFAATRWHVDGGRVVTDEKHDVTQQFDALAARPVLSREALEQAIRTVYDRHDNTRPLNHVNVVEWVDVVLDVLATEGGEQRG